MIQVFFNIDDTYKQQCETVINSIVSNTKEKIQFHVIGVDSLDCDFANVKCYPKPDTSILTHTVQVAHITMTSTYRLFAPFIFNKLDKIIYFDSDLIVLDDIKKLWDTEVKYIAGVPDGMFRHQAKKNNLHHTYINTGVLVLNLKNLRNLNYIERIEKTQNGNYNLSLLDQDIINIAFEKEIELLPPEWNVLNNVYGEETAEMIEARNKPSVIHWAGRLKPWNDCSIWQANKWSKYSMGIDYKFKKAIVLTYADITKEEAKLLKETDVFKIACNTYCAELKPNVRLCSDNIVDKCLECDTCPVISCNYDLGKDRVINGNYLPKRNTTLIQCIDYLLEKGYTHILLVATNPVGKPTYKLNNDGVNQLKRFVYLFKYSQEGTFDIPVITIKEFLKMTKLTDEEKILGMKEPAKKLIDIIVFTEDCKYEVHTKGYNNHSIESGKTIATILPVELKSKLQNGEFDIEYNGLVIKRITGRKPIDDVIIEPVTEEIQEEQEEKEITAPAPKKKPTAKKKASKKK